MQNLHILSLTFKTVSDPSVVSPQRLSLTMIRYISVAVLVVTLSAFAQHALYSASAKAQGAPFDLVFTEIKRESAKSYVVVPGFHNRTAAGSRWFMCAYTDIALKRGFSYWSVVYPEAEKDVLVIAFANTPTAQPAQLLGSDFAADRMLGTDMTPTAQFMAFCGLRK